MPQVERDVHSIEELSGGWIKCHTLAELDEERIAGKPISLGVLVVFSQSFDPVPECLHSLNLPLETVTLVPAKSPSSALVPHRLVLHHHKRLVRMVPVDEVCARQLLDPTRVSVDDSDTSGRPRSPEGEAHRGSVRSFE